MGKYLANRFERYEILEDTSLSTNPSDWNHHLTLQQDMRAVLAAKPGQTTSTSGRWYLAKCKSITDNDSQLLIGFWYSVFVALNGQDPKIGNDNLVAAPCPPFCGNDQVD